MEKPVEDKTKSDQTGPAGPQKLRRFPERFREVRQEKRFSSAYALADKMALNDSEKRKKLNSEIIAIEEGRRLPTPSRLEIFADAIGVTRDYLLEGSDYWERRRRPRTRHDPGHLALLMTKRQVADFYACFQSRVESSQLLLRISGITLHSLLPSAWFEAFLQRKLAAISQENASTEHFTCHVMMLDPDSEAPKQFAIYDQTRTDDALDDFVFFLREQHEKFENLREVHKRIFDYRLLPFVPSIGLFISDPELPDGIVKAEIYVAKPWTRPDPPGHRPHLVFTEQTGSWRKYFLQQWENFWNLGNKPRPATPVPDEYGAKPALAKG